MGAVLWLQTITEPLGRVLRQVCCSLYREGWKRVEDCTWLAGLAVVAIHTSTHCLVPGLFLSLLSYLHTGYLWCVLKQCSLCGLPFLERIWCLSHWVPVLTQWENSSAFLRSCCEWADESCIICLAHDTVISVGLLLLLYTGQNCRLS
jgi:hypothetical protein